MPASTNPTEVLAIAEVELRASIKKSSIYSLIKRGLFPPPLTIGVGGSRWIAREVDEYIARRRDERDRQRGVNKFAPRPAILSGRGTTVLDGFFSDGKPGTPASLPPSTVRMLPPEVSEALRILKVDIPELYLDSASWNVSLAVVKVQVSPVGQTRIDTKGKKC
jgi:predicted DNA-binding transcriptional regulator AlpA